MITKIKRFFGNLNRIFPRPDSTVKKFWLKERPEIYLPVKENIERSLFLADKIKFLPKDAKILEVGCNCGRNLNFLYQYGYENLYGIELNPSAVSLLKDKFPKIYHPERIRIADVNELEFTQEYDLVFTMAVLEHIPDISFIKRIKTKYFITMEDERGSARYWFYKRNYRREVEAMGFIQTEEELLKDIIDENFTYRLFEKI